MSDFTAGSDKNPINNATPKTVYIPEIPMRLVKERWYHKVWDMISKPIVRKNTTVIFESYAGKGKVIWKGQITGQAANGDCVVNSEVKQRKPKKVTKSADGKFINATFEKADYQYIYFRDDAGKMYRANRVVDTEETHEN